MEKVNYSHSLDIHSLLDRYRLWAGRMPTPQEERNTLFVEQAVQPVKREWYSGRE
jgi:hypothetical protein